MLTTKEAADFRRLVNQIFRPLVRSANETVQALESGPPCLCGRPPSECLAETVKATVRDAAKAVNGCHEWILQKLAEEDPEQSAKVADAVASILEKVGGGK